MTNVDPARVRLGRIRCLVNAVSAMRSGAPLPAPLCFVPKELHFEYEAEGSDSLPVHEEPKQESKTVGRLQGKKTHKLVCAGLAHFDAAGGWMKMTSPLSGWVLLQPARKGLTGKLKFVKKGGEGGGNGVKKGGEGGGNGVKRGGEGGGNGVREVYNWLKAVELVCPLQITGVPSLGNQDEDAMAMLQAPPPGWSTEADEELAQFLVDNNKVESSGVVCGRGKSSESFADVVVSSEESEAGNIFDPDPDVYWESDGSAGQHWIRFVFLPGTIIERLALVVDPDDGSYLPRRVVVKVGSSPGNLTTLHTHSFGLSDYEKRELQLFPLPLQEFKEVVEVHIKSCYQGGIDVRIHGVTLTTKTADTIFLTSEAVSRDIFTSDKVSRYPKLQGFTPRQLFSRALVLSRVAFLLDTDLTFLLPAWESDGVRSKVGEAISAIRQLWPLSRRRNALIEDMLSISATSPPSRPTVYIDRMAAKRHAENPSEDREGKRSLLVQLQRELKKHTKESNYNFRWAGQWSQWWECKFAQEGMIDQGGGFRDLLSDLAEELCPSSPDSHVPLSLFIRSPNQNQDSSNAYRDNYIPNPACEDFAHYIFVGQLMGAMVRSQEHLVLSLSQLLWKQLVGEQVTWSRDFVSVDSAEVRFIESIESMSRERFDDSFAGALRYTTVLSGGEVVSLVEGGTEKLVDYDDRLTYCRLVKETRMKESQRQVEALRKGIVKVVPPAVLQLLTWQEMETRVCGSPDISVEKLKKSARYEGGLSADSAAVKTMWEAISQFSNEERSRLLRFVTGRRRLPCTIYIDSADGDGKLPTSATCSNTLYLPEYDSVSEALDRLRYAAYNCVAIDTDMTVWE